MTTALETIAHEQEGAETLHPVLLLTRGLTSPGRSGAAGLAADGCDKGSAGVCLRPCLAKVRRE